MLDNQNIRIMATKKFQKFTRPLGSVDGSEGKLVLEDFDVDSLRKSMEDIIRHATRALTEMDVEIPSTTKVCICYEDISNALEEFERSFFRHDRCPVK